MKTPRFFETQEMGVGDSLELGEQSANHIARVLRLRAGAEVVLFNGRGGEFVGTLVEVERRRVRVALEAFDPVDRVSALHVHLGQVISRGHRMEYAVQKATELGVAEISPLFSARCEVRLEGDRLERRREHWRQVAIHACEQCGRNRVPEVHLPRSLSEWLRATSAEAKWIMHGEGGEGLARSEAPATVALAVGPEGGFEPSELREAEGQSFQPLQLGPRVFRTESAPVVALSLMQSFWGDLAS